MTTDILVDSDEFWKSLEWDILRSKHGVYIQTLSFEGDRAGRRLVDVLVSSDACDKRLVIDWYTRWVLSDRFLYSPANLFNRELRHEASETARLIGVLTNHGIQVKFTNPPGALLTKFAKRNHKKIIVIDDRIAYIGGMNFSEHNLAWHDMMLRIEDSEAASFLREDFLATWDGRHLNTSKRCGDILLYTLDGCSNEGIYERILNRMQSAQRSIFVECPYVTHPFYEKLREARRKGVAITIIAPAANNWKLFDRYVRWESARSGFDLRLYQRGMTHLKAMLIDEDVLILGSSNFDYLSYSSQQEILAICMDPGVISCFKHRVIENDLRTSARFEGGIASLSGRMAALIIETIGRGSVFLSNISSVNP